MSVTGWTLRAGALAAVLGAASLACGAARAEEPAPPPVVPDLRPPPPPAAPAPHLSPTDWTFLYERSPPPGSTPWRAALEEAAIYGVVMGFYASSPFGAPMADAVPFTDKLTFDRRGLVMDADNLPTNYPGHASAGWWYYAVARANRLTVPTSFAVTTAMSLAWELSEFKEPASINDLVTTSAGGFGIGEALTQLGAWFDRDEGIPARLLSFVAQPPKMIHDWMDGATPARGGRWGYHRITLETYGGVSFPRPDAAEPEWGVAGRVESVRAEEYGAAGRGARPLLDGNATAIAVKVGWGPRGIEDVGVLAEASLVGAYARDIDEEGNGEDLVAVAGTAFDYRRRTYPLADGEWKWDYRVLLHAPGASLRWRLLAGGLRFEPRLDAALLFGAVTPYGNSGLSSLAPGAPGVMTVNGYYHGLGAMVAPRLVLLAGRFELGAGARLDALQAVTARDVAPSTGPPLALADRDLDLGAGVEWHSPWSGWQIGAWWRRELRWGRAGDTVQQRAESRVVLGLGVSL
jgi:hypothetical protein